MFKEYKPSEKCYISDLLQIIKTMAAAPCGTERDIIQRKMNHIRRSAHDVTLSLMPSFVMQHVNCHLSSIDESLNRFDDIGNITEDAPTTFTTHNHYPRIDNKQQVRNLCINHFDFTRTPWTAFCHFRPI